MAIFPGEPGLASFIGAKDDGVIRHAKLRSNHHHQQTNTQLFTGRMPFLSPNQQCWSTEESEVHVPPVHMLTVGCNYTQH